MTPVFCQTLLVRFYTCIMLLNLIAFHVLSSVGADGIQEPLNTAVVAGNRLSITCGHNFNSSPIKWSFKPEALGESLVYDGSKAFRNFTVTVVTNGFSHQVTLTKKKTHMEDAGIYKCLFDRSDQMIIRTAHLIVLETDPACGTNKSNEDNGVDEGTFLHMWCNINFTGDPAPVMKWSRNDGKEFEATPSYGNGQISYAITKAIKAEDNGKTYSCTTYFEPIDSTDAHQSSIRRARNAPSYRYKWNFTPVVSDTYTLRSRNLHVEPLKKSYTYGNRLNCWGDGDEILAYRWVSVATGAVTHGSYLPIDDTMASNVLHVYECVAYHEKSNTTISKSVNITIADMSAHGFNKTTLLVILLPIGGVVLTLNLGLLLQKRHIRRTALEMASGGNQATHHYDEEGESAIKSMTTEMTATEPPTRTKTEATPTITGDETPQETVSQALITRPYSSLASVRPLPDIPVYSSLETISTSTEGIEGARDNPTIEVHYVNVPMINSSNEDPVYMDLPDND